MSCPTLRVMLQFVLHSKSLCKSCICHNLRVSPVCSIPCCVENMASVTSKNDSILCVSDFVIKNLVWSSVAISH